MKGFEQLYEHLMTRIQAKIPQVVHIDLWNGQTESEASELSFNAPAIFIEFAGVTPSRLTQKRYGTLLEVRFHVVHVQFQELDNSVPAPIRTEGLAHMRMMDNLLYWMDQHRDNTIGFNSMSWIGTELDSNRSDVIEHVMSFRTRMVIDTAKHALVNIPKPPLEIQDDLITEQTN